MNKEEADAKVAKSNELRDQLDSAKTIAEFDMITSEYEQIMGYRMLFPTDQYKKLLKEEQHADEAPG